MDRSLHAHERDAYLGVLKAVALSPPSWETEDLLASLRQTLHISNEVHMECRRLVEEDAMISEIRHQLQTRPAMPLLDQPLSTAAAMPMHGVEVGGVPPMVPMQLDLAGAIGDPLLGPGTHNVGTLHGSHVASLIGGRSSVAPSSRPGSALDAFATPSSQGGRSAGTGMPLAARKPTGGKGGKIGAQQAARMIEAVPSGLDIMEDDLRGYTVERRRGEEGSWQRGVIVACKRETNGQRLTLALDLDTPAERLESDVYLRKNKAGLEWRFVLPAERQQPDFGAILARGSHPAGAATLGGGAKKRKEPDEQVGSARGAAPPFADAALQDAIAEARTSGSVLGLERMVAAIRSRRSTVVDALASVRVQEILASPSRVTDEQQLRRELENVRAKKTVVAKSLNNLHMQAAA